MLCFIDVLCSVFIASVTQSSDSSTVVCLVDARRFVTCLVDARRYLADARRLHRRRLSPASSTLSVSSTLGCLVDARRQL